ncbi:MAG TPA: trypsin-like peptidase domain-containing protein, partial [Polyangiaceae bacterium]|nr:trypsin-like peptidase domain-containing protein [Polyangiaceae bacterium]
FVIGRGQQQRVFRRKLLDRGRSRALALGWMFVAATSCKGWFESGSVKGKPGSSAGTTVAAPPGLPAGAPVPAGAPSSFADLVARADPAVVFIKTQQEREGFGGRVLGTALGSAFIYDSNGLILTNHHVIEGATDIQVIIGQSRVLSAKVIGKDPPTDVAVLKVEATELPTLPLGDSDAVRVGDWVIAIGNPFGLTHTVSAGILSAKDRTNDQLRESGGGLDTEGGYYDFLQTDASINPGNSGGPLLDSAGRVVGINAAIRDRANSIGFAIPINMVREILPRLLQDGEIRRSAIGVKVATVLPDYVSKLGLPGPGGALVRAVVAGGPADRAGVAVDDVIVAFDNKPVPAPEKLRWLASLAGVDRTVTLKIVRGGRTLELRVKLNALAAPARTPE